jgi:hypothetical protein
MFSLSNDLPVSVKIFVAILLIAAVRRTRRLKVKYPEGDQG